MKMKWEPRIIENVKWVEFDKDEFEQLVDEMAGLIYSDMCQLSKIQLSDSFNDEINFLQRTGTDA
jgi:hypothetical protein